MKSRWVVQQCAHVVVLRVQLTVTQFRVLCDESYARGREAHVTHVTSRHACVPTKSSHVGRLVNVVTAGNACGDVSGGHLDLDDFDGVDDDDDVVADDCTGVATVVDALVVVIVVDCVDVLESRTDDDVVVVLVVLTSTLTSSSSSSSSSSSATLPSLFFTSVFVACKLNTRK
jgi:hypothetical protein